MLELMNLDIGALTQFLRSGKYLTRGNDLELDLLL